MKSIVKKITGLFVCCTAIEVDLQEDEVLVDLVPQIGILKPYYNFETQSFYETALDSEITANQNALENTEDENIVLQLITDGNELYKRHKERLRRRVFKGNMTLAESKTVRKLLREAHSYLRSGDFDIALDLATLIVGQPNKIQNEIMWLIEKINLNTTAK